MKVLITGAKGQLGSELQASCPANVELILTDAQELDITDAAQIQQTLTQIQPAIVINAAAYTAVDKAEADEETAYKVNSLGAGNLAKSGAKIIHISTDYVFDGTATEPYQENVPTNPLSVYGKSKLKGEEAIQEFAKEWIIIRT